MQVYIVRSKSGKGWNYKVKAEDEYQAKVIVACHNDDSPDDYFAYLAQDQENEQS